MIINNHFFNTCLLPLNPLKGTYYGLAVLLKVPFRGFRGKKRQKQALITHYLTYKNLLDFAAMKKEKKNLLQKIGEFFFGETIVVQHSFFGEIIDVGDYYECRKLFKPIGKVVDIGLEKKAIVSDEKQINFFNWIEDNYELIIRRISPFIEKSVAECITNYRIKDFKKEFILEYLYIPKCDEALFNWRICFYADNELQHSCSLEMKGLIVKHLLIDG